MKQINLSEGLILLSGLNRSGKTGFSLKLGNYLATQEKVLYLNFDDYEERLRLMVEKMDTTVNEKFDINCSLDEFCIETYVDILSLLENNDYSTIIIDNLNRLIPEHRALVGDFEVNLQLKTILDSFLFIIRHFKCRIILVYELSAYQLNRLLINDDSTKLNDFKFPRSLVNYTNQILFLSYPYSKGYTEDEEGESLINHIDLYNLKNENHKEEHLILDNSDLNIYVR